MPSGGQRCGRLAAYAQPRAPEDLARLRGHVFDLIGPKPIADVTPADIRGVVEHLDEMAHDDEAKFSSATAGKVWTALGRMFRDACRSKVTELRVREGNPCQEAEGPDRGD